MRNRINQHQVCLYELDRGHSEVVFTERPGTKPGHWLVSVGNAKFLWQVPTKDLTPVPVETPLVEKLVTALADIMKSRLL